MIKKEKKIYKVPEVEQYENFTEHLRYLDDKIFRSFTLFVQIATVIVGAKFYIEAQREINKREFLYDLLNWTFLCAGAGIILLISNNLRAWRDYRTKLSECYPEIENPTRILWCASEWVGCVGIAVSVCAFLRINSPTGDWWNLSLISICFSAFAAHLPFLLKKIEGVYSLNESINCAKCKKKNNPEFEECWRCGETLNGKSDYKHQDE